MVVEAADSEEAEDKAATKYGLKKIKSSSAMVKHVQGISGCTPNSVDEDPPEENAVTTPGDNLCVRPN